jgi:membrane protease YdiL (CAAX protease family)
MNTPTTQRRDHLWVYTVLAPILIGLGSASVYFVFYAMQAMQPERVAGITSGQLDTWISLYILAVRWVLALSIVVRLRRAGGSVMGLIAPQGQPWRFRWRPAIAMFLLMNVLVIPLVVAALAFEQWNLFGRQPLWQRLFWVIAIPLTAGFTEELIWRGYAITCLEARGRKRWPAILLSALSFALIHGTPVHWIITFIVGVIAGAYYTRERNLVPLIVTHAVMDLWSFGVFLL